MSAIDFNSSVIIYLSCITTYSVVRDVKFKFKLETFSSNTLSNYTIRIAC